MFLADQRENYGDIFAWFFFKQKYLNVGFEVLPLFHTL